jgi:hypothetical protein
MRRYLIGALMLVVGSLVVLSPAPAGAQTTSCGGVLSGANGPLTKSLASVVNNNNGTFTLTYNLTSTHNPPLNGTFRVRDCVFVDAGGNNAFDGEPLIGSDEKDVLILNGSGQVSITVTASADDTVCDRAAISGTDAAGVSFTDKSNLLCTPLTSQPPIPEVPYAILLPLVALVLFGGAWVVGRRRGRTTAAAGA